MREKLTELIKESKSYSKNIMLHADIEDVIDTSYENLQADYLLQNGVVVKECGKWANAYSSGTHLYRCTECGEYIEAIWTGGMIFKYCPNCGARMEEM